MLKDYVPSFLYSSLILEKIYTAQQKEIDSLNVDIQDLLNQCCVETATWGLVYWEEELGIETVLVDSYEIRRSSIKARLRGQGTITPTMIKNVAMSFANGEIDVVQDNANYAFTIKFISKLGIPPKLEDLKDVVEDIKPAHLKTLYEYYNTHKLLNGFTHEELAQYTHTQLREIKLIHLYVNTHLMLAKYTNSQLNKYSHNELRKTQLNQ